MNSFVADGGSTRVVIPHHLRKTIRSIREITGKQHSDEDIFSVFKESFNDPHETAQKLLFLDTFHEVRRKREKKKENLGPIPQGSGRTARRNFASNAGNGRSASFKRESGTDHVAGGSRSSLPATNKARNFTVPRAIKLTSVLSGVSNRKVQDDFTATVNKRLEEENHLSNSTSSSEDGVDPEMHKAVSGPVAAPVSNSVVQNHTQDVASAQISQPIVNNQPAELQSTFARQDPSLVSSSHCSSHSDQFTESETASDKGKAQSVLKLDVGDRSHVTFPLHLQVAELLQNGLTFGSFDSNFVKEESSNSGASGGDDSIFEFSHMTGDDNEDCSPATNSIPGVASAREGASSFVKDKDHGISTNSDHIVPLVTDELKDEALLNTHNHHIAFGQEVPLSVFGLVPSFSALGQPIRTEAAETQPGNSNAPAVSLVSYTPVQCSTAAASQQPFPVQATHLLRQQYIPNFFPYGPYYPPFYMPPPYIHQFLSLNGIPQQSYFPPGVVLAAPTHTTPVGDSKNPPTTHPSSHASATVATHIPSTKTLNSIHSEGKTSPLTENTAAWVGQGPGNLQVSPMYNLALQGQPLGFPLVQAGNGGIMVIPQQTQPMAAASTTYQTLLPPPHTTTAVAEPIGHPHIAYQQPQDSITNLVNN